MADHKNYDELLYPILHHQGNIVGFLDTIFEFLYRRTDFFKIKERSDSTLGFLPGEAEKLVKTSFCKFMQKEISNKSTPPLVSKPSAPSSKPEAKRISSPAVISNSNNLKAVEKQTSETGTLEDIEVEKDEEKVYQNYAECYNGATYDHYSWAQTIKDLDVYVKVPQNVSSSTQVKVNIKQQYLKVEIFDDSNWNVLLDGALVWKINVEQSAWTLLPHNHILLSLEKVQERWWDSLMENEPKINVRKIDASQNFQDLDEESQAKIQELMFNEHQKRLGKPTVEQIKMEKVLREAWNIEGSPFQGQPFDPSIVKFADSSSNSF